MEEIDRSGRAAAEAEAEAEAAGVADADAVDGLSGDESCSSDEEDEIREPEMGEQSESSEQSESGSRPDSLERQQQPSVKVSHAVDTRATHPHTMFEPCRRAVNVPPTSPLLLPQGAGISSAHGLPPPRELYVPESLADRLAQPPRMRVGHGMLYPPPKLLEEEPIEPQPLTPQNDLEGLVASLMASDALRLQATPARLTGHGGRAIVVGP